MKRVLNSVGQLLTTAALTSIAFDTIAAPAIANPDSVPPDPLAAVNPEADSEVASEELVTSTIPAIAIPELANTQQFSQSTIAVEPAVESAPEPAVESAPEPAITQSEIHTVPPASHPTGENLSNAEMESSAEMEAGEAISPPLDETPSTEPQATVAEASPHSLEDHLAEIVERDRPEREARLRENLAIAALHYAQVGDFEQARHTAQNPALPPESQAALLTQIDELEAQVTLNPSFEEEFTLTDAGETIESSPAIAILPPPPPLNIREPIPSNAFRQFSPPSSTLCPVNIDQIATPRLSMRRQLPDMLYSLVERAQQYRVQRNIGKCASTVATSQPVAYQSTFMQPGRWGAMTYPLAVMSEITSGFGWRIHPITGDRRFHYGVDFGAAYGTPVVAALTGRVVSADFLGGYGLTVVLEHEASNQRTLYAHLSGIAVEPGSHIQQGQVIGWVGSTGNSTGPHLHFEVQTPTPEGWVAIDPLPTDNQIAAHNAHDLAIAHRTQE